MTANENILGPHPFRNEFMNQREINRAMIIPTIGARNMNAAVFNTGSELTAENPPA